MTAPYVVGSDTSKAAAESVEDQLGPMEAAVLTEIRTSQTGRTDDEIEVLLRYPHQTASARRRGLVLKGLIADSGKRRLTRSGRKAVVWVPASEAPDASELPKSAYQRGYEDGYAAGLQARDGHPF